MGAGSTPAGWYPDVERQGAERYWNGSAWTEDRRSAAAPGAPQFTEPAPAYGQPVAPAGYSAYGAVGPQYPGNGLAGWGLGLSIFGIFCCQLGCIAGAIMGWVHLQKIKRGERDPGSRGLALAAVIVGGIGTALLIGVILFYVIVIGLAAGA